VTSYPDSSNKAKCPDDEVPDVLQCNCMEVLYSKALQNYFREINDIPFPNVSAKKSQNIGSKNSAKASFPFYFNISIRLRNFYFKLLPCKWKFTKLKELKIKVFIFSWRVSVPSSLEPVSWTGIRNAVEQPNSCFQQVQTQ